MGNKERAIQLLDQIPENKMSYIIDILESTAIPNEIQKGTQELENGECTLFAETINDPLKNMLDNWQVTIQKMQSHFV